MCFSCSITTHVHIILKILNNSYHESLYENSNNTLYAHDEYSFRAFLIGCSSTVTDGMLSFDREEETTSKRFDSIEARGDGFVFIRRWRREVSMRENDEPPDESEQ